MLTVDGRQEVVIFHVVYKVFASLLVYKSERKGLGCVGLSVALEREQEVDVS